jgi:N-acylglucosamine 2-epimerase
MANAEYYGLTHEKKYLEEARKYHKLVVDIWKDPANDPFKITPKFLPTAPAMRGLCNDFVLMLVTRALRVNDPENREDYMRLERVE